MLNKKFWEAIRRGDDIHLYCHPDDFDDLKELLAPLMPVVKALGPLPVSTSPYIEQGIVFFLNKTKTVELKGLSPWAKDMKPFPYPLMKTPSIIITS